MTKPIKASVIAVFIALTNLNGFAREDLPVVKIGGSTTTYAIFSPMVPEVEKVANVKIEMTQLSTGAGIAELVAGKTMLSMTSEPLDVALEAGFLSGVPKSELEIKSFSIHPIVFSELAFVVHHDNPVSSLSWEQMRHIQTGTIKNWKAVGGNDSPITVYAEKPGRGTRAMVIKVINKEKDFGSTTKAQDTIEKAAELVSTDPSGFAAVGINFVKKYNLKQIQSEKFRRPIGLIAKGQITPLQEKVIDAFHQVLNKN